MVYPLDGVEMVEKQVAPDLSAESEAEYKRWARKRVGVINLLDRYRTIVMIMVEGLPVDYDPPRLLCIAILADETLRYE